MNTTKTCGWDNRLSKEDLAETILAFADCGMSTNAAAKKMYLSRATVTYRLHRVQQTTGLNPYNFYDLCELVAEMKEALPKREAGEK